MRLTIDHPTIGEQDFVNVTSFVAKDESVEVTFSGPNGPRTSTIDGTLVVGVSDS